MTTLPPLGRRRAVQGDVNDFSGRSVRFAPQDGGGGLATATYCFQLSHEERCEVARRIAALWNLMRGIPTGLLEALQEPPGAAGDLSISFSFEIAGRPGRLSAEDVAALALTDSDMDLIRGVR